MLEALAATVTHVSLHSAFPGSTGAGEISGGAPAYGRSTVTWVSPVVGAALQADDLPSFNVPSGATIAWAGLWNHATATSPTNFFGYVPLGSVSPFLATALAGTDILQAPGHPLADGQSIALLDTLGTLPAGVTEGSVYFVRDATTDTFKVSTTVGGIAIDLTTSGVAEVSRIFLETYNGQGFHTFTNLIVGIS
jgi:hypothetical protein